MYRGIFSLGVFALSLFSSAAVLGSFDGENVKKEKPSSVITY